METTTKLKEMMIEVAEMLYQMGLNNDAEFTEGELIAFEILRDEIDKI